MAAARAFLVVLLALVASAAPEISTLEQRRTSLRAEVENLVEVATQHLKTDPRHYAEDTKPRVGDGICDICVNAIQSLEEYVSDPETQANMAKFLEEQVCDALPDNFRGSCRLEVPLLVNTIIIMMKQSVPPASICALMGICDLRSSSPTAAASRGAAPWAALLPPSKPLGGPLDCPMCRAAVAVAMQRLQDPVLRAQLQGEINAACDTMSPADQPRCHAHVVALFKAIDNLMHDIDPEGVCELALFCPRGQDKVEVLPVPEAARQLQAAFLALAATPRTTPTPTAAAYSVRAGPPPLGDSCESCKAIISEAAAIVEDPKTQREIINYAKQGCQVFQDFKEQCVTYVDMYGPLLITMAVQYLQPQPLCARMGYCPPPPVHPAATSRPALASASVRTLP